jgi:hypothetical protein
MDLDALEDKARAYNARNVAIAAIAATSVDPANTGDAAMFGSRSNRFYRPSTR